MVVLGSNSYVLNYTWKTVQVYPFSLKYEALIVPIVDSIIQYDDLYSG